MLHIKSKMISSLLLFCVISGLLFSTLTQADTVNSWGGDSGRIDAGKAAEQRAASARRAAKKQKLAEAKKAAEAQKEKTIAK
jgi:hypothetical protein